jgi:Spy/CpxP family protein refolding chaperone
MKKPFLLVLLLLATTLTIHAQGGMRGGGGQQPDGGNQDNRPMPTPKEIADRETAQLTELLELTPEQVVKVKAIVMDYTQQRFQLMQEIQILKDQSAAETKLKGIKMAQDNALNEVLTPEQQAVLKKGKRKKKKGEKKKPAPAEDDTKN